jgi:type IV pilus assembly protein PilM
VAKQTWALDLGDHSLKIARGRADKKTGKIIVDLYDEIRYEALGVTRETPFVDKLRAGLDAFREKYQVGKTDVLCVAISGSEVFSRFINLPPVPESISEIIRYEARQHIPFDINEVVWDYQPLKEEFQPGEEIEVGLFALKRESVTEFMRLLEPWRGNLRVMQNAPLAVYNFLRFENRTDEPVIVLDMGSRTTDVLIINHPRFWVRPLLIGGGDLTARLQSHFGVSYQEAERIKERAAETAKEAQLLRVIRPVVGNMVSEIQRSLGYYKSLSRGVMFNKILALGNAFKLRGLDRVLAEGLQYQIEKLTELRNFELAPSVNRDEFMQHLNGASVALGLLVQGTGLGYVRINLIPTELAEAMVLTRKVPWLIGAVAGIVLGIVVLLLAEKMCGEKLQANLNRGEQQLKRAEQLEAKFSQVKREADGIESQLQSLASRKIDRNVLLRFIPRMIDKLPEDVYVGQMDVSWMEPAKFNELVAKAVTVAPEADTGAPGPGAGGMPHGMGGVAPGMGGMGPGGMVGMGPGMGGIGPGMGGIGPGMGGMGGGAASSTGQTAGAPTHSANSAMVVTLDCESTVIRFGLSYIENSVIAPLKKERYPDDLTQTIFKEVVLVGQPQDIYRDATTGSQVDFTYTGEKVHFVAFRIAALVNTAPPAAKAAEKAERQPEG